MARLLDIHQGNQCVPLSYTENHPLETDFVLLVNHSDLRNIGIHYDLAESHPHRGHLLEEIASRTRMLGHERRAQ